MDFPMRLPSLPVRFLRHAAFAAAVFGLLLPQLGSTVRRGEAPWLEQGWPRSFAMPRPSLPGESAVLECAGPVPAKMRLRLHKVKDPSAFLKELLEKPEGRLGWEAQRAGHDPFDVLREAFLWGGRRTFATVHRTATRALRDTARETDRLQQPMNGGTSPREGEALPLERSDLAFVQELIPEAPENEPNAVRLPAQGAGLYLLEVMLDAEVAYVPWLVSDLALLGEQDGSRLRVTALGARDGAPASGAQATLVSDGKASPLPLDAQGEGTVTVTPGVKRFVWAQRGEHLAILSIEGIASATPRQRVYAYTERPLYRPGQEVFVKAIVRSVEKGENILPKGFQPPKFRVLDPEDTEVAKGQAELLSAETATYGAKIQLPNGGRLGLYRVIFDGPAAPAQAEFKVEQFVKPAFAVAVTTPTPKVGVGDELAFHINARYFYGAAVRSAKAEWFLYQVRPSLNWWDDSAGPAPELKESGTLDLDEDGEGDVPGLVAKEEGLWRLVVKVADGSGQRNGGQAQTRCAKGDLVLLLSPDRELVSPGQPFKASVRVLDLEGKEVKGVPVTIQACTIRFTQRGRENGTSMLQDPWAWSYQHRPGEVLSQGAGPEATLTVPKAGLHLLYATATDRSGRKVEAIRPITVATDNTPLPPVADMKAAADKREYRVGETARILVRLPKPNLHLRWVVEGEQIGERFSRKVMGTSAIVEIPVTPALQPNAWAVFEILHDGRRQMAEVPLRVPKVEKKLQVVVTPDKERYQPGETMKVNVAIKDHQGRPKAADLSVGVVDEAIYALSAELHPDPFRFFHPTRRHLVTRAGSTDWSFYDLLRRARDMRSLKKTARGEFKEDDDKVRKNFKDTAAWFPFVAAGADGQASVELQLPDNLTAWRATATAVTADTSVGVGRASKPASKPLQVMLTIPRTLSRGDEARAIAMVRNLSGKPIQGKVRLDVKNGALKGGPEASFTIPDQGEYRFALPLLTDQVGPMTVTARVEGQGLKDGEQQRVEVVEPLVPASQSGFVSVGGAQQQVTIPVPPNAKGEATLVLTPVGSVEQLVVPSLPYLIQYPYGCVEQTLSSFVPNLLVADLVKKGMAPEIDWRRLTDLDRNIRDGVFRVYGYQLPNGGWGWWAPKDFGLSANPHTTGYALQSFATMKRLGYSVDENVYRRGREAATRLFQQLAQRADAGGGKPEDGDAAADAAFVLMSLSRTGEPIAGLLDSSADKVLAGKWKGADVLAMLTLAAAEVQHPKAQALVARLEQAAQNRGGIVWWEGPKLTWWSYHGGDLVPTSYALRALCLLRPQSPLIPGGEAFLASRHEGYGWYSTWSTAQAVELIPYLARTRKLNWEAPAMQASIEGGPSFDFRTLKRDPYQSWRSREPRPGSYRMSSPQAVKLSVSGSGLLVWTYGYQVPGGAADEAKVAASGLRLDLKRSLWRLRTPQETGNAAQGWVRQPWTGTMKQGEEAWMELELGASKFSNYAMLEVPIPAGLEPTVKLEGFVLEGHPFAEEDATSGGNEYDYEEGGVHVNRPRIEVHPDKVTFLFPQIGSWERPKVRILLRAAMAGSYTMRPPKLSLMSNESQWVTASAMGLKVTEGGAK
jgi:hypothetical protein